MAETYDVMLLDAPVSGSRSRLEGLACLAREWQRAVDQGLGEQDLTVVTQTIAQQAGPS